MSGVLLQLIMIAADPRRVDRRRLRESEGFKCSRQTYEEYAARFNGWYYALTKHVHNTEVL